MKNNKRIIFYLLLIGAVLCVFAVGRMGVKERSVTAYSFDTVCDITAYTASDKPLANAVKILEKYDKMWSAENEDSEIFKLNNGENVSLSNETSDIIAYAESFEHDDLFNIYIDSLVKDWDIKNNQGNIPDVSKALADMHNKKGINLGGVAKVYVCDKIAEEMKKDGVSSALINLGGNVYALGKKPTGEEWRIGIADPKNPDNIIGSIRGENLSVVTSGDYQRYFEKDGVRYHHIFDSKTGFPANSEIRSATIIGESSALCDVLSTMVFVAGVEEGAKLLKEYNVGGIIVTDDTVYFSKNIEYIFKQSTFSSTSIRYWFFILNDLRY